MTLLDALAASVKEKRLPSVTHARMVHFAFSDRDDENAFISEIDGDELVQLLEEWCRQQRMNMGTIQ